MAWRSLWYTSGRPSELWGIVHFDRRRSSLSLRPNLFRDFTAVTRTAKWTVFREMGRFPWNSVKFCNFARSLIHFLNIFPMPVLYSAFAITFTQIINNYPLKCNPFELCLLTVQQSSDWRWYDGCHIALNVSPCKSVICTFTCSITCSVGKLQTVNGVIRSLRVLGNESSHHCQELEDCE